MNNLFRKSACLFPIIFLCLLTSAQSITGSWNGTLHVQSNNFPIVFHIGKDSDGKLIATFDSPSQNAFDLAVSEVFTKEDSITLMMAILNGKYAGVLSPDKKTINGTWFQGSAAFPLNMMKTSDTATVKQQLRPQTPKPPFSYQTKDVEYWNADKSIRYGATLTSPAKEIDAPKKGFPAVILITGSGQQDRDETMLGHKPFAVIAGNLTKKGFAVLRVDDRGMGKTTGDFSQATSLDFAKDVEAGLDFLEAQPEVNKENIGLIGHSEGGLIAPIVAGERKDVKFIVLLAGPGIPTIDLMQQQSEAIDVSGGHSLAEAKATSGFLRVIWEELNKNEDTATTNKNIRTRAADWAKTLDTATLAKIRTRIALPVDDYLRKATAAASGKWFRYFISFNPQPYLQKLQCKVLALGGSKDVQVIAQTNLPGITAALQKSHSSRYDVIELPGLNHLFQTCTKCSPAEYGDLEETFSPTALAVMDDWLLENVR
ncbi:MAG: alpha/beta fold hydrolase [Ginsengibacter sp.]